MPELPGGEWVDIGHGRLFVRHVLGPPGAPTLLLLHGWTATADLNWFTSFAALGEHFRVIAFDHRGHGRTGLRTTRRFRLDDCAADAIAIADALGVDRFIPVGYSMGGAVASLLARDHSSRVSGLVLAATAPRFGKNESERRQLRLLGPLSTAVRGLPMKTAQRVYEDVVWRRTKSRNYEPWVVDEIRSGHPRLVMEAGLELGRYDSEPWLPRISVPTSVVITTNDDLVPPDVQRRLLSIPGAREFTIDGDHIVCVTKPAAFREVLVDACRHVGSLTQVAS